MRVVTPSDDDLKVEISGLATTGLLETENPGKRYAPTVLPLGFQVSVSGSCSIDVELDGHTVGSVPFDVRVAAGGVG
ncbi:hypothetical protein Acsp05_48420 [Actinokineospora sp. NBRC 105648]|nr:hypothetical protein Acsp05_48420 [Actinokineospora sp. NBRC 105648]